jgi:hypothetical protein
MPATSPPPVPLPAPRSTPAPPSTASPHFRAGEVQDLGTVRRDSVDADRWTAHGTVKVTGEANVGIAQIEGTVSIGGKLTAGACRSHAALDVEGPVDVAGTFTSSGRLRAAGTLHAVDADLRGATQVVGAVSVDRMLTVRGSFATPSVTVGALDLEGEARIPGDVVGLSVSAHFTRPSALGTVRANSVDLHAKIPNFVEKILGRQMAVTVRKVEADVVNLEGVDVKFVRSPKITLGREAHVTEYEGTIVARHPSSRVGFESRSPRPYGLSR